ncbi:MAG: oligosaccharide flippase family protein [Luteitalea sp.]|nr:oligosaccharide flippase family protein [Luteitalea sp.]
MALPQHAAEVRTSQTHTYGQILRSTALIGGSTAVNLAFRIVRAKAMALLLGPTGVGLLGLYNAVADLTQSVAGMGVQSSGVRQIAEAVGSGDQERIARTVVVLRRASILLGILGAGLLVAFAKPISQVTFGSDQQALGLALLSVAVFFRLVSVGQGALIQGMRRVKDLAAMTVVGALLGTLSSILLVYFFRERGIVPSLLAVAALSALISWRYSRSVRIDVPRMTFGQVVQEAAALFKLGAAFMASGMMMMGSAYAVRIIVLHRIGFEATGLYQSAWAIGGLYVGFILQAMGADFYPRLTACAGDNAACNRLVNEQARVGMLLGGPGALATLTLAPVVLALFYSSEFSGAVEVLRWICLGVALRVISWPMGFIVLAKGRQNIFFWSELAWSIVNVGLTWVCVGWFGLSGAGIAFFASYVFHGLLIYSVVRTLSGFRWSPENLRTGLMFLSVTAAVFCGFFVLPLVLAGGIGIVAAVLSGVLSLRALLTLVAWDQIPKPIARLLVAVGFVPADSPRVR